MRIIVSLWSLSVLLFSIARCGIRLLNVRVFLLSILTHTYNVAPIYELVPPLYSLHIYLHVYRPTLFFVRACACAARQFESVRDVQDKATYGRVGECRGLENEGL